MSSFSINPAHSAGSEQLKTLGKQSPRSKRYEGDKDGWKLRWELRKRSQDVTEMSDIDPQDWPV